MSEITRWELMPGSWVERSGVGGFVDYRDHLKVVQERDTLARRAEELETTLRSLRNEGYAILALSTDEIKQSAGYTNLKCFEDRLSEATQALLNAPPVRD